MVCLEFDLSRGSPVLTRAASSGSAAGVEPKTATMPRLKAHKWSWHSWLSWIDPRGHSRDVGWAGPWIGDETGFLQRLLQLYSHHFLSGSYIPGSFFIA